MEQADSAQTDYLGSHSSRTYYAMFSGWVSCSSHLLAKQGSNWSSWDLGLCDRESWNIKFFYAVTLHRRKLIRAPLLHYYDRLGEPTCTLHVPNPPSTAQPATSPTSTFQHRSRPLPSPWFYLRHWIENGPLVNENGSHLNYLNIVVLLITL